MPSSSCVEGAGNADIDRMRIQHSGVPVTTITQLDGFVTAG